MPYSIQIKDSAQKELDSLQTKDRRRVEDCILSLAENPRPIGAKPLKGKSFKGLHRIRSGNFRVIYQILDQRLMVIVVKVGDRKDVYD